MRPLALLLALIPGLSSSQAITCRPVGQGSVDCAVVPAFQPRSLLEAYEAQGDVLQMRRRAELEAELTRLRIEAERRRLLDDERRRRESDRPTR